MKAWIITWDNAQGTGDDSVVMVLNGRMGTKRVRWYVEMMYIEKMSSDAEKYDSARPKKRRRIAFPAEETRTINGEAHIHCGHNPWLFARLVDDLRVEIDDDGVEMLKWKERI